MAQLRTEKPVDAGTPAPGPGLWAANATGAHVSGAKDGWGDQLQDWIDNGQYRHHAHLRILERLYEYEPYGNFLDVGCGRGDLLSHFSQRGVRCLGMDYSPRITAYHSAHRVFPMVRASVSSIPLGQDRFDLISCLGLIEHLDDPVGALRELRGVTRPGGRAVITVPRVLGVFPILVPLWYFSGNRYRFGWRNMVGRMYSQKRLRDQLLAAGWEVEYISPFKGSSVLEWLGLPFSRTLSELVEGNPVFRALLSIMLVAVGRKPVVAA